ncbi:tetratricopeptide repeat protein [Sphingomonas mesophila]|uniref:tetratricopeptide repeat protein n=1 Tax=Sphingomonas mesophila TaxID=2303576 RepID=UPI000E586586|nr:tetratricopeptide repeat protein [Sphingomonas mesophila]
MVLMPGVWLRFVALSAVALGLGVLSLRDWSARAPDPHPLARLEDWWPDHPRVATELMMVQAGTAARSNTSLNESQQARLRSIARKDPLRAQPYLLAGAVAQLRGDAKRALGLYRAARQRDPRDTATRLVLADLEIRTGHIEDGLNNLIAVTRIEPKHSSPVAPALAKYAQSAGADAALRRALAANPDVADVVLSELASDASNAALIASIAPPAPAGAAPSWRDRLIDSNVAAGDIRQARALWSRFNRPSASAEGVVFNGDFRPLAAGPPFNWSITSSEAALAELRPGGGLSIVHFGRAPALIARQLILLSAGRHRLVTSLDGPVDAGRLEWRLRCANADAVQAIPIDGRPAILSIAPGCPGYWLELHALPAETERQMARTVLRVAIGPAS